LEDHYVVDPPDKVRVIQRGIDPNVYFPGYQPREAWLDTWNRAWGSTPRAPTLVLPGRLTRLKGHEALFPLVRSLVGNGRDVRVAVVGGADPKRRRYARGIQSTVRNDPVLSKHIVFLGHRSDLREIMSVADIVLSLSTRPESFGRTVLEALSLGTPVVGYRHGGVGEILNEVCPDGAVDPDKPKDVVARIESFLESPPLIANHEFTLQNMCRQTIAMYQELSS
jgi:glycosyltransferase involved in cell wall biosynthesis